jgi:hypothetical protein
MQYSVGAEATVAQLLAFWSRLVASEGILGASAIRCPTHILREFPKVRGGLVSKKPC